MWRETMHRSRTSFKKTPNAALRIGLAKKPVPPKRPAFEVKARPLGLRPGIDPGRLNQLADDLEADAFLKKMRRSTRAPALSEFSDTPPTRLRGKSQG